MAPTLYMHIFSPPVRGVLLTAAALGVELQQKIVNPSIKQQMTPEYIKINPQHTIPTLVEEDGFTVWDSHAISGYLVNKYGKDDSLYPRDIKTRAVVDQRLQFDSGVLFGRLLNIARAVLYRGATSIERYQKEEVIEAYEFLEAFLEGHEYLVGNQMTIADLITVANITSMDILVPINRENFPNIGNWVGRLQALPYYNKIQDEGLQEFRKRFAVLIN